jgi:enamine deaminase RidA (YjgF/YER057c/UK114 family)
MSSITRLDQNARRPARCCGAVTLALPDIRVEIMAVAAR